jgi:pyruvate kinase
MRSSQIESVAKEDITCVARNSAQLDGLLTVFHTERSTDALQNVQNDLPILNDYDKKALEALVSEFEIDFISLSFVREADDLIAAREFLDSVGGTTVKVRGLFWRVLPAVSRSCCTTIKVCAALFCTMQGSL